MARTSKEKESEARELLDDFSCWTGLEGNKEQVRYLWTDAFAVFPDSAEPGGQS